MNVIEMVQSVALAMAKANGSFHASDVQKRIGDGTKLVHISYVRAGIGKLVKLGKLKTIGEGANRMYADPSFEYTAVAKDKKVATGQPRSAMRILDLNDIVPMAENE